MATKRTATTEEVEIHQPMESWTNAVRAKDIDALMSHYAHEQARDPAWRALEVCLILVFP
jgi:hypothetical protein